MTGGTGALVGVLVTSLAVGRGAVLEPTTASARRTSDVDPRSTSLEPTTASAGRTSDVDRGSTSLESTSSELASSEATSPEAVSPEGVSPEGVSPKGVSPEGVSPEGVSPEGVSPEGVSPEGVSPEAGVTSHPSGEDVALDAESADSARTGSGLTAGDDASGPLDPSPAETSPPAGAGADAPEVEFDSGVAIGGYYGHGEILEQAPPDGREQIIVGSILVPLGTLAAITSGVGLWLTVPEHCVERLARIGTEVEDSSRCTAPFTLNAIRTTYGALMLASGATILALGMIKRERYRKWKAAHGMRARVDPVLYPSRRLVGGGLRLRF